MTRKYKYLAEHSRGSSRSWVYKRPFPNRVRIDGKKSFVRALGTSLREAELRWKQADDEYNALTAGPLTAVRYQDKEKRRKKFWQAVAEFILFTRRGYGGTLPPTDTGEVPTATRYTSHAFSHVLIPFETWARQHDPEALEILRMRDAGQGHEQLFLLGLIGSYFTVCALERLESDNATV